MLKSIVSLLLVFAMSISTNLSVFAESGSWKADSGSMKINEKESGASISYEGDIAVTHSLQKALTGSVIVEFDMSFTGARMGNFNVYADSGTRLFYIKCGNRVWGINGRYENNDWREASVDYDIGEYSSGHYMFIIDTENSTYSMYVNGNLIIDKWGFLSEGKAVGSMQFNFNTPFKNVSPQVEIENFKVCNSTYDEIKARNHAEEITTRTDYFADIKDSVINNRIFSIGSGVALENMKAISYDSVVYEKNGTVYIPRVMIDKNTHTNGYVTAEEIGAVRNGNLIAVGSNLTGFKKLKEDLRIKRIFGIYISGDGDDENDGTYDKPLKTLDAAKRLIKEMKSDAGLPNGGAYVYFRGGEYSFSESVNFNKSDSGTDKSPITYRAYPGEEAKLIGSTVLPSEKFKNVTDEEALSRLQEIAKSNVTELDLKEIGLSEWGSVEYMGQPAKYNIGSTTITVNGELMEIAKWPNDSYSTISEVSNGAVIIENERIFSYRQPELAFLYGWSHGWYDGTTTFNVDYENRGVIKRTDIANGGLTKGKRIQIINALEELDKEGEWFVDSDTSKLYIWLPDKPENCHITMSMLKDNFINIYGTRFVNFERLYFGESRGNGVYGEEMDSVKFSGCIFKQLGRQAINIKDSKNCEILSCDISEIGRGGIFLTGGDKVTLTYGNNVIKNCHIRDFSMQSKTQSYGIDLGGVGNYAVNNQLNDVQHQAIYFSGNYNTIAYNEIYNVIYESNDAGAIYTGRRFTSQGNKINYNFIHDITKGDGSSNDKIGIYMDDQQCGSEIIGNLIVDCSVAMLMHGGREHTIKDNLSVNCVQGIKVIDWYYKSTLNSETDQMWVDLEDSPYKTELWQQRFPRLINIRNDDPAEVKYNNVSNNVSINNSVVGTYASSNYKNYETHKNIFENNIDSDDLSYCYDIENYDFKVNENSDIFKSNKNLTPVPFEKMGMYYDKYRTKMPKLGEFEQGFPENNSKDIEADYVTFNWELSDNASKYEFILAKDKNFTNIVLRKDIMGMPAITVEGLDYNETDYYWKVIAKMNTKLQREERNSDSEVFKFTTAKEKKLDTALLKKLIARAEELYKTSIEGEEVGTYKIGAKAELNEAIASAKKLLGKNGLKQDEVLDGQAKLKAAVNLFSSKGIKGDFYLDEEHLQSNMWINGTEKQADGSYLMNGRQNASIFKISQFETLHMKVKFNLKPSYWEGITVRNQSNSSNFYSNNTAYGFVVKEDILEFQQYTRPENDFEGKNGVAKTIDNEFIKSGEWYDITINADNTAEGVKITVTVNGEVIFDMLDDRYFSVLQDGYINMATGSAYFMPVSGK